MPNSVLLQGNFKTLDDTLEKAYGVAESIIQDSSVDQTVQNSGIIGLARELAKLKHAARGAALTLLAYKFCVPQQDIRAHKDEYQAGFSGRSYDNKVTVPFLIRKGLPRSVESHWLTQTLSYAPPLCSGVVLKTTPKTAGPLLVELISSGNQAGSDEIFSAIVAIIYELILERNRGKVSVTKPKNLPIATIQSLLDTHFRRCYKHNAPRLPQLAIYAIYMCIIGKMARFDGQSLDLLQRLRSADRKSGTVGDIVVSENGRPIEAVEIKFGKPISFIDVAEAVDKVRAESVNRYYLLSTDGVRAVEVEKIKEMSASFLKQNGCEIIVNGVIDTIGYYLRLLPNTSEFLANYATLVESDPDTGYEHRIAWNEACGAI